ncbi:S66 peptidase family protein [Shimazuella kribbensis]|uniref:S66 peptidase family protein n=1 Tax=Shimazuella kribbensis TaxID=139808 RepID=UPI0004180443|nr:LD-carboxypeptidase [Shimazuella kribbensis]
MMMPKSISRGSHIGIIAPASPLEPIATHQAIEYLEKSGFVPVLGDSIFDQQGFLAGSDESRLADVHRMFADPMIDAILCLRGGYGSMRIVDQIDYDLIRCNPKWLIGYSDITMLLIAIYQETGLSTIHGPMLSELPKSYASKWWESLWETLESPTECFVYPKTKKAHCLFPGKAEGPIIGGNLSLLAASLGTPFEVNTVGHILFIEEVGENPYRVDRMLTQLRLAGKLQAANGILFGHFTNCQAPDNQTSISLSTILAEHALQAGVPAFMGFPSGHSLPNYPVPIGALVHMDANSCELCLSPEIPYLY